MIIIVTFLNSDAGDLLFCGRKWIDPADPDGRTKLDLHHFNLCALFPAFAAACPHTRFIAAITAVTESWSRPIKAVAEPALCRTIADFAPDSPVLPPPSSNPRRTASKKAIAEQPTGGSESTTGRQLASGSAEQRAECKAGRRAAASAAAADVLPRVQKRRRKSV